MHRCCNVKISLTKSLAKFYCCQVPVSVYILSLWHDAI